MTRVSGDDWRVCIVAAGPGTGKTTFAAQWLAGTDGAWLSLDDAADHPETFWLSVATALQRARPGAFDATEQLATRSRTDSALFVMQFLDDAAALERSLEFVLEDFHVLRNPAIIASFASVIENLPAQLRFVITSRSDPALPTARWRAHDRGSLTSANATSHSTKTKPGGFLPPSAHQCSHRARSSNFRPGPRDG